VKAADKLNNKIVTGSGLMRQVAQLKFFGKTIAFTNGCFDILHAGHIESLKEAAKLADYLIVAVNSDESVRKLKGEGRPVNNEENRALVLAALSMLDAVVIFNEDTPLDLIKEIKPDFLVKGGDYKVEDIAGAKEVIAAGGKVIINPIKTGFSTTGMINKLKNPHVEQ
jgi:D-glycero-beta-D-manno-heptose 1-phosphate adenylyltransferase